MDGIPDEILTEILASVPYSKRQHQSLALVSRRFHNVVRSGVFRAEAARNQFPDFALILDHRSLSSDEFAAIAWREAKTEELLNYAVSSEDEHENTRRMVKVSIVLIDYITSLNDSNPRGNSLFLEMLKRTTFDPDLTAMLRYSLGRIFDLFYRQDRFWFVEIVNLYEGHPSHLLVALSAMHDSMHAHSLNLMMMRTFEALVLRRTDRVSFLESIFKNGTMNTRMENVDTADHQGRAMYTRLAKIYVHVLVDLPQPEYSEKDFSDFHTAMKAFDWRPLSQVKSDFKELEVGESIRTMRCVLAGIVRKEMDDASYYTTECTQTAGPWEWMLDIVNLDIKAAGKAMRDARLAVKVGKIPRVVIETADRVTPSGLGTSLRKLSIAA